MAAWVTVYCSEPVDCIEPGQVLAGICDADYRTLAELFYEVDEDLVDPALERLRIVPSGNNLRLYYRPGGQRQLEIHRWSDSATVAEEIREVLDRFEEHSSRTAEIQSHLPKVQGIVAVEMEWSQLEDMGVVFAYEVARWFAQNCQGLTRDHWDKWFRTDESVFVEL